MSSGQERAGKRQGGRREADQGIDRAALIAELERAIRNATALGVLHSHAVADRLGMNSSDMECLDILHLRGEATAGELAAATGLTTGAITGVIDRLERASFARRERDRRDRRKVLVRPLPAALETVAPLFAPLQRSVDELMSRYSDEELRLLLRFFSESGEVMNAAVADLRKGRAGRRPRTGPRRG
jgi:DNA-binding MarR family transcriptional regulator